MTKHSRNPILRLEPKRWLIFSILALTILVAYYATIYNRAFIEIGLTTNVKTGFLQIYWASENEPFSEERSETIRINGRQKRHYSWYMTDLRSVRRIRVDPLKQSGRIRIHYIKLSQEEIVPIKLKGDRLHQLKPVRDISEIELAPGGLLITSSGADPGLIWHLTPQVLSNTAITEVLRLFCILVVSWAISVVVAQKGRFLTSFNRTCLWVVLGLIICMAILSEYNKHPDEYVHTSAGLYFDDRWLPPEICQPGTERTYSVYGVSRLNSKEVFYFLAGKIASLTSFLPFLGYMRMRFVNILLFIGIIALWYRYPKGEMLFIPILVSPQIWYIFSYFNSDAFSLFVIFFICYQILNDKSFLQKWWKEKSVSSKIFFRSTVCGMMFGMILLIKLNYYIMIVFLVGYFIIECRSVPPLSQLSRKKIGGFLAGVVAIYAIGVVPHWFINGYDHDEKITECREKLAKKAYKPSTPLDQKWPGAYLKKKGFSLKYLLEEKAWGEKLFRSFFGVYGYTTYAGSPFYYQMMKILCSIFLVLIMFYTIFYSNYNGRILLAWTILCTLSLITSILWKSWTSDFQAQGRYLMPIIPMIGMLMHRVEKTIDIPVVRVSVILLYFASCYSLIFVGLMQIPKI